MARTTQTSDFDRAKRRAKKFFSDWRAGASASGAQVPHSASTAAALPKRLALMLAAVTLAVGAALIPAGVAQASSGGCPVRVLAHNSVSGSDKFVTCAYVYGNLRHIYYVRIWASGDKKDGSVGVNVGLGGSGASSSTNVYMKWPNWVGCVVHAEFYGPMDDHYHELVTDRSWNSNEIPCGDFNADNHQFDIGVYQYVPAGLYCGRLWYTGGTIGYTSPGQLCVRVEG